MSPPINTVDGPTELHLDYDAAANCLHITAAAADVSIRRNYTVAHIDELDRLIASLQFFRKQIMERKESNGE